MAFGHPVYKDIDQMYLNWVLVKDKLHQVSVLKDENFDVSEVALGRVR